MMTSTDNTCGPTAPGDGSSGTNAGAARDEWPAPPVSDASEDVAGLWGLLQTLTSADPPPMGLTAGMRPSADVDTLITSLACVEYELAHRMDLASRSGSLPLAGEGAMLLARRWSSRLARRLARTGAFAAQHESVAAAWRAGVITSEHVDVLARRVDELTEEEMAAVVEQLAGRWGHHSPEGLNRFVQRVIRALHPPPDPEPEEVDAYASRGLSFSVYDDTVLISGNLPRLEGEAVMTAVEAWAEKLRSADDHIPASARRADGLVALVNGAAESGSLPGRGGLPVSLTVTLEQSSAGDPVWSTSRGHALTAAEERFVACSAEVTPLLVQPRSTPPGPSGTPDGPSGTPAAPPGTPAGASSTQTPPRDPATRVAALAAVMLDELVPLAVGRTRRSATAAQRRAMAARDSGCVVPGCEVPAESCQAHHLIEWANGGSTDADSMVLLCWSHHRQVDLGMWTIRPANGRPPAAGSWPANGGSPWVVEPTPRNKWRW